MVMPFILSYAAMDSPPSAWFAVRLELIEILLRRNVLILFAIVALLRPDVKHQADRQIVQVCNGDADLDAAQQEKRRCQFAFCGSVFFLASAVVIILPPHNARISGSTS